MLAAAASVAGVGCEDDPVQAPREAARVGGHVIAQADVEHYIDTTLISEGYEPAAYKPPRYSACVRDKQRVGEPQPRRQCAVEYGFRQAQALRDLIRAQWFTREAKRRGLRADVTAVEEIFTGRERAFAARRPATAAAGQAYVEYLRANGVSKADLTRRLKASQLEQRVTEQIEVSDAEAMTYYSRNRNEFGDPEQRRLRFVKARSPTAARNARRALASEASWERVALRFGDGSQDGRAATVVDGYAADPQLGRMMFAAPARRLQGPVRTREGIYLFQVDQVIPAQRSSFEENRDAIVLLLRSRVRDDAMQRRYGPATTCARRYRIPEVPECRSPAG